MKAQVSKMINLLPKVYRKCVLVIQQMIACKLNNLTQTKKTARNRDSTLDKRQELEETEIMHAVKEANLRLKATEILLKMQKKESDRNK